MQLFSKMKQASRRQNTESHRCNCVLFWLSHNTINAQQPVNHITESHMNLRKNCLLLKLLKLATFT